jgi:hypothetical protein
MHVAHCESMDKTALEADTSPEKIKSNYLDLVTKKDAKRYWEIRPGKAAGRTHDGIAAGLPPRNN